MRTKKRFSDVRLLAVSIGLVYLWFGLLKFFPGLSPAEDLAINTIDKLTLGFIPQNLTYSMLAIWESALGIALIMGFKPKIASIVGLIHMVGTFTPLFLFPDLSFASAPFQWTLVSQYIFKNIVFIVAFIIVYRKSK